jgi:hypothetical protein
MLFRMRTRVLAMGLRLFGALLFGALTVALLLASPVAARAATLDFEGIGSHGDSVPNGYGLVDWDNFLEFDTQFNKDDVDGYHNGLVSGQFVAYNGLGDQATISRSSGFNLLSGYFTAPGGTT